MDALIPILFAIAYFIFQAYTGYQKEQEKAAKRTIGKPNPEVYKPETPDYPVQRDVTPYDPARSQGPAYEKPAYEKATYKKPSYEKPVYEKPAYEKTDYQTRNIEKPYVQTYQEPVYQSTYKPEKYVPTERPASLLAEYRRLAFDEEDIVTRRAREARRVKRAGIKRLETEQLEMEKAESENNSIHFDMREAVIMKAILDRPHT